MFFTYLELGWNHILDLNGLDHLLFLIALCAPFEIKFWKKILILITAFTIGHSLSLAAASFQLISIKSHTVELLIAISIGITALQNIVFPKPDKTAMRIRYFGALAFGLIHGLGFSSYFQALLGKEESIFLPLLAFNCGIELAQILIVVALFIVLTIAQKSFDSKPKSWNLFLSGMAFGVSLWMIIERI